MRYIRGGDTDIGLPIFIALVPYGGEYGVEILYL